MVVSVHVKQMFRVDDVMSALVVLITLSLLILWAVLTAAAILMESLTMTSPVIMLEHATVNLTSEVNSKTSNHDIYSGNPEGRAILASILTLKQTRQNSSLAFEVVGKCELGCVIILMKLYPIF